ncbi:TetR family transcriptional regulator [Streptomyces cinnamoneus]|uniref:TetR family transcriptional regulator n=1 Tax=Streptomyces cinnamoneus TaxID=53446 RepID=A0A2G1XEH7_STRCJ|nr:TetR/AcrR family transcriptional regulator C-terminal domain-containing protein [Streptomyces cinnamoneus]PHQ49630.1 TetR family transcriptional regulator [Streptomyces cinnamoneus]PPT14649.1 TetR family transcriptional regulator [Streptomyces cinnamoneus]
MSSRIDRALVAGTALRLLNEVGLEGLTVRRIAKELNVQAPALYWHFKNKQELLDAVATEMFRRMAGSIAAAPRDTWQEYLAVNARGLRGFLLGYRDGAKVFGGTRFTDIDSYAAPVEQMMRVLVDAGFTPDAAARAWFTVNTYTMGYVMEEQSVFPDPATGERDPAYALDGRARRLEDYPLVDQAGHTFFGDMEKGFDEGLRAVVAGIEATLLRP